MKEPAQPIIRILLADDHPVVLSGLRSTLASYPQCEIVGEVLNGLDAVQFVRHHQPDIVLMDIVMPTMNGIQATRVLRKEAPNVKILALTMHNEKEYVIEIIKAGAKGYLLKDSNPSEIIQAIENVYRGNAYFSPSISNVLLKELNVKPETKKIKSTDRLSPRETEVLQLITEGLSNKEIADRLFISLRTVETHRERIMKKLNVHSVAGLTKYAIQKGIVKVE